MFKFRNLMPKFDIPKGYTEIITWFPEGLRIMDNAVKMVKANKGIGDTVPGRARRRRSASGPR
ncbi:hypothetical protein OG373_41095 [Streptomyces avidinii]|nr:hypothetical protein OG373_41095 [Streptomyces avidinii]